ncbi:DNA-binding CsgD family transcriptional regulator/cell division protein FtsB [Wenyingzhuangia aestuarii]|nr:DNA-binding CsgD family transcriptional regulator/cell division protein FtsB [Wenyingzhuangia aestuarii]
MAKTSIFFTLFFLSIFSNSIYANNELDSLLVVLEEEMLKQKNYDQLKEQRIENLKKLKSDQNITLENKYFINNKIILEYEYYSFDNALFFIEENISISEQLDNNYFIKESSLKLAKLLAMSGRFKESIDILNEIHRTNIPKELLQEYFFNYQRCYSELNYYSIVKSTKQRYINLFHAYKDSLNIEIAKLNPNSLPALALAEESYRDKGEYAKALALNTKRLSQVKLGTREYSMIAFERSYTSYDYLKEKTDQKKYLALSAISDIKASVKDNASLTTLAVILFEEGYVDKAHKYISFSFDDAKFYNSQLRFLNISNILPLISKSYETQSTIQKTKLKQSLIFISVLFVILIGALFYIFKQFKKLEFARNKLKSANNQLKDLNNQLSYTNKDLKRLYEELSASDRIKEQYIGTFLNLYSEYINKLDVYRKMVVKDLTTNKINALLEITKSKQVIESELKLFYSNFDESFLHIYPNFVQDINALLKEDKKIVVKKGELLNTELRIYALIRLGITNSTKISKILRYSVNTIYNYRVKNRNAAINRDEFENMVKKTP